MTTSDIPAAKRARSGISLLEVLISIGILSIGLLSTLALIPAGRFYMKRAAVDDRAAAVVPSAFSNLSTQGMLGVNASSWLPWQSTPISETEAPVIRELTSWTITSITSELIDTPHQLRQQDPPSTTVTGNAPPPSAGQTLAVNLKITTGASTTNVSPTVNQSTGDWTYSLPYIAAPDMEIFESGPKVGEVSNTPYADYTYTATYTNGTGPDTATTASPSSIRQYGYRRKEDLRRGRAQASYQIPSSTVQVNDTADTATNLASQFPTFDSLTPPAGNRIWRAITASITSASVARWNTGLREGDYSQRLRFSDSPNATGTVSLTNNPRTTPITADYGDTWITGPTVKTDVDWYKFNVRQADLVTIDWSDPTASLEASAFPLYLNTTDPSATPLTPVPALSSATSKTYYINADGFAVTRAAMNSAIINREASYAVTFTRHRTGDRAVVIDPVMATRLDKTLPLQSARRMNFASFQQLFVPSLSVQPLAIPRLNREAYAQLLENKSADTALALSEFLFHGQDAIAIAPPVDEDSAPRQVYDLTKNGVPLRRQAEGKGSWMIMLEPTGPGPVSCNWSVGSSFNASIVVFDARPLPAITAAPDIPGEYAFEAVWDDLDGMITATIPASLGLVEDDIRPLFKAGYWIMLAPKTVSDASSAEQTFDWVQIVSATLQGAPDGGTVVKILPAKEPAESILNSSLRSTANPATPNQSQIWVLVYEGAVAVVTKTIQLQP